jgi:hypothetical protein
MISSAFVEISCDKCTATLETVTLTKLTNGEWTERNLERNYKRLGWRTVDGLLLCPRCVRDSEDSRH